MTRPARTPASLPLFLAWTLLVLVTVLSYARTLHAPFVFDDIGAVTQNPSIGQLATALTPPPGLSVTGRPVVNLTLALNHAISGRAPWSYHVVNLALHLATAAMVFALLRRTLQLVPAAAKSATSVAFATTALWTLHPLQTAAVSYVMQRTEVLVSLCLVVTLYAYLRYATSASGPAMEHHSAGRRGRLAWAALAVGACAIGMATKEVMVTAPLLVVGFDRVFISGSFTRSGREHHRCFIALAATWTISAVLVWGTDNRGGSAGFGGTITPVAYAQTQVFAIAHYLKLAIWPRPLVFDYGSVVIRDPALLAFGAVVCAGLLAVMIGAWRRHAPVAFAVGAFLLLLAPSSSVVPIATQTLGEHRLYLALVLPLLLGVLGLRALVRREAVMITSVFLLCGALAAATYARNFDYGSARRLWADTVAKQPANARAHYNLGLAAWADGDTAAANAAFLSALALEPSHGLAHLQLGRVSLDRTEARPHLIAAAQLLPDSAVAAYEAGVAYLETGRPADALPLLERSVRLDPSRAAAHYNLGSALAALQRYREALAAFETAARLDPADPSAARNVAALRRYLQP